MRFFRNFILILCCLCLLGVPASALSTVSGAESTATAETDGSCYVSLRFEFRLEQAEDISLWLPAEAEEIRVENRYRTPETDGTRKKVTLKNKSAGSHTVEVSFRLPCALESSGGKLWLEIPLLSGVAYPMESFRFSVNLPGETEKEPVFTSGYHGEGVSDYLSVTVAGNRITGSFTQILLDRESLSMKLEVSREMFPDYREKTGLFDTWQTVMLVLIAVSLGYYLLALMPSLPRRIRSADPPDGLAAGELGTCLTGCGMDLTMMVFSWAQLGYLRIRLDSRGRVTLVRCMDMGNERSERENRAFRSLFSQRDMVDGGGLHYARLCRKLAASSPLTRQLYKSTSGNPRIVRVLALAAGVCSGVELSLGVYTAGAGTVFLAMGLALLCGILAYFIQLGGRCLPLGNRRPLWTALLCVVLWALLGRLCGNMMLGLGMGVYELLTGIAAAVGGRRSALGQQYVAQIRGLRHYFTRTSVFDMQQNLELNPDYFFDRMPYALALGVEKPFARRFGKAAMQPCSYLEVNRERGMTASQWAAMMRHTADRLNRRQRRLKLEKLLQQAEAVVKSR